MRNYPHNSPEAAARIVALVLIADGHACRSEFDVLEKLGAERELGLEPQLLPHIVHTLRAELLTCGFETGSIMDTFDDGVLASLMGEISDVTLQRKVLRLSLAAAQADGQMTQGEAMVLTAARLHWKLSDGEEPSAEKAGSRASRHHQLHHQRMVLATT